MKNLWKMSLILLAVCAIAAGSLSFVYTVTKPRIEKQQELEKMGALKEVMPEATKFAESRLFGREEVKGEKRWIVYKEDKKIGIAIEVTAKGYGGPIHIIFGLDKNKKVTKVKIIEQNETPGLGNKIKDKKFISQFDGKIKDEIVLKKNGGKIDAISGATISSRAVTNAIRDAINALE